MAAQAEIARMHRGFQQELFSDTSAALPSDYCPQVPRGLDVRQIVLAQGSTSTPERATFVESIPGVFRGVPVLDLRCVPHNRVDLGEQDDLLRHASGKRTLVMGELKPSSAVRCASSALSGDAAHWHFSV